MTYLEFSTRFGLGAQFEPLYSEALSRMRESGADMFSDERILALEGEWGLFPRYLTEVREAARELRSDEGLMAFGYLLYLAYVRDLRGVPLPDEKRPATEFLPLFSVLYLTPEYIADCRARSIPDAVIADSLREADTQIGDYAALFGRPGCRIYGEWLKLFLKGRIFRLGRLNFEMTVLPAGVRIFEREGKLYPIPDGIDLHPKGMGFGSAGMTDGTPIPARAEVFGDTVRGFLPDALGECTAGQTVLRGVRPVLSPADPVISVHIPTTGGSFSPNACDAAFALADAFFARCFPEFSYEFYFCHSWLMDKRLSLLLGRESNIGAFADRFTVWPGVSAGQGVFEYLYCCSPDTDPSALPEDSALRRAVKRHLLAGGHVYEKFGAFKKTSNPVN